MPDLEFPCVVKPIALSGSRGVIRADDPESLQAALEREAGGLPPCQLKRYCSSFRIGAYIGCSGGAR
mgnify:CR=1 FL=1